MKMKLETAIKTRDAMVAIYGMRETNDPDAINEKGRMLLKDLFEIWGTSPDKMRGLEYKRLPASYLEITIFSINQMIRDAQ